MSQATPIAKPTVSITLNEAAVLASITRAWVKENTNDLTAEQQENWNALIAKLRGY